MHIAPLLADAMAQHTAASRPRMLTARDHRGAVDDHIIHTRAVLIHALKGRVDLQGVQIKDVDVGKCADLIVCDDKLNIKAVFVDGVLQPTRDDVRTLHGDDIDVV